MTTSKRKEALEYLAESDQDGFFYWISNNEETLSKSLKTLGHSKKEIDTYIKSIKIIEDLDLQLGTYLEEYQELEEGNE